MRLKRPALSRLFMFKYRPLKSGYFQRPYQRKFPAASTDANVVPPTASSPTTTRIFPPNRRRFPGPCEPCFFKLITNSKSCKEKASRRGGKTRILPHFPAISSESQRYRPRWPIRRAPLVHKRKTQPRPTRTRPARSDRQSGKLIYLNYTKYPQPPHASRHFICAIFAIYLSIQYIPLC